MKIRILIALSVLFMSLGMYASSRGSTNIPKFKSEMSYETLKIESHYNITKVSDQSAAVEVKSIPAVSQTQTYFNPALYPGLVTNYSDEMSERDKCIQLDEIQNPENLIAAANLRIQHCRTDHI